MSLNIERLMDFIMEAYDNTADYTKSSRDYYRKHGYGVNIDRAKTPEEKHIAYMYHSSAAADDVVRALMEVLNLDYEQQTRAYSAARALKRWYEKTQWNRLPSSDLIDRIWGYIQG